MSCNKPEKNNHKKKQSGFVREEINIVYQITTSCIFIGNTTKLMEDAFVNKAI